MDADALAHKVLALLTQSSLLTPMLDVPKGGLLSVVPQIVRQCWDMSTHQFVREPVKKLENKTWRLFHINFGGMKKQYEGVSIRATSRWRREDTLSSEVSGLSTAIQKPWSRRGTLGHCGWPQALLLTKIASPVRRACFLPFGEPASFGTWTLILPLHHWQH